MPALFVTSSQPGAGSTALCVSLARWLRERGRSVAVFKPVSAPREDAADPDPAAYERLLGQSMDGWPADVGGAGLTPDLAERIQHACGSLATGADTVIIEGSSALPPRDVASLVERLDARVVVVARYLPGLTAGDLTAFGNHLGDRLLGYVINGVTRYRMTHARAAFADAAMPGDARVLGLLPEDRALLAVSVADVAVHLGGRFAQGEGAAGGLVEHFLVGCNTMDNAEPYFRLHENKGVVARGDRPDVQMACLATPTRCLVLSGGIEPIEYVAHEAEEAQVPVIVVDSDTIGTMERLATVQERARFDHESKLTRFRALLDQHADVSGLLAAAGIAI